jgi:hypothetical protein
MKKLIVVLAVAALLLVSVGSARAEEVKKPRGKSVMMTVKLESEVEGNAVKLVPRVVTLDRHSATIKIGDTKAELDGKPVKFDKDQPGTARPFLVVIEVTPTVVDDVTPPLIKMDIKFSLNHNNFVMKQNFQTVVRDGDSFLFESSDATRKQKLGFSISASIQSDKADKPRSDAGDPEPCAERMEP